MLDLFPDLPKDIVIEILLFISHAESKSWLTKENADILEKVGFWQRRSREDLQRSDIKTLGLYEDYLYELLIQERRYLEIGCLGYDVAMMRLENHYDRNQYRIGRAIMNSEGVSDSNGYFLEYFFQAGLHLGGDRFQYMLEIVLCYTHQPYSEERLRELILTFRDIPGLSEDVFICYTREMIDNSIKLDIRRPYEILTNFITLIDDIKVDDLISHLLNHYGHRIDRRQIEVLLKGVNGYRKYCSNPQCSCIVVHKCLKDYLSTRVLFAA